jgi:hypothetical protein
MISCSFVPFAKEGLRGWGNPYLASFLHVVFSFFFFFWRMTICYEVTLVVRHSYSFVWREEIGKSWRRGEHFGEDERTTEVDLPFGIARATLTLLGCGWTNCVEWG